MRKPIVAGNWKMNGSRASIVSLLQDLKTELSGAVADSLVDVVVCPPALYIEQVQAVLEGGAVRLGAQNCSEHEQGAYTGEISPQMLADFGVEYVIVGHSERRALYGETSEQVAKKVEQAQRAGLLPVLCVGETQAERESGATFEVIQSQLEPVVGLVGIDGLENVVIAYEPVWAIGTGLTASPQQAQEVHQQIRSWLAVKSESIASSVRIIYGGSVKADNAKELMSCVDIDGGLIGGASLVAADFAAICSAASGL